MARVLIAADDPAIAEFMRRVVAGRGHTVTVTPDGGAAARAVAMAPYDLVLADIRMPVMDGIALALEVAEVRPETQVVLITGYAEEKERSRGLEAIVARVLSKPLTPDDLLAVVDDLVGVP